jgi:hypothetical protein
MWSGSLEFDIGPGGSGSGGSFMSGLSQYYDGIVMNQPGITYGTSGNYPSHVYGGNSTIYNMPAGGNNAGLPGVQTGMESGLPAYGPLGRPSQDQGFLFDVQRLGLDGVNQPWNYDGKDMNRWDAPDYGQALATSMFEGGIDLDWFPEDAPPEGHWRPGYSYNRRDDLASVRDAWRGSMSDFQSSSGFGDNIGLNAARFLNRDVDGDGQPDDFGMSTVYNDPLAEGATWGTASSGLFGEGVSRSAAADADGMVHQDVYVPLLSWMLQQAEADPEGAVAKVIEQSKGPEFFTGRHGDSDRGGRSLGSLQLTPERLAELQGQGEWAEGTDNRLQLTSAEQQIAGLFLEDMAGKRGEVASVIRPQAEATRRYLNQTPQASDRAMRSRAFTGGPDSRARSTATRRTSGSLLGGEDERRPTRSLLGGRGRSLGIGGY